MQRNTFKNLPNLKASLVLLSLGGACLTMIGCGGDGNCYNDGCTFAAPEAQITTTPSPPVPVPVTPQNDPAVEQIAEAPPVVVVVVPSTPGDTSGGGTTIGAEINEPLDDAPATTTDNTNRPTLIVDQLTARPTIDGSITTTEWGAVLPHDLATTIHRDNMQSDTGGASARLGWFGGDLYIAAHIPDARVGNDSPGEIHEDDSSEIFIDLAGEFAESYDANDYQILTRHHYFDEDSRFEFGPNSSPLGRPSVAYVCRYHQGTRANSCEFRVSGLGLFSGRTLGFDYQVNDDDDGNSRDHKTGLCPGVDFTDQAWFRPAALCRLVIR